MRTCKNRALTALFSVSFSSIFRTQTESAAYAPVSLIVLPSSAQIHVSVVATCRFLHFFKQVHSLTP